MATPTLRNGKRAAVLEALRQGNTRRAACEAAGIDHATFYRWLADDATLCDAVKRAEADAEQAMVAAIKSAIPTNWTAAAWWLERRRRDDYGRQEKLDVRVSGFEGWTDEELDEYGRTGRRPDPRGAAAAGAGEEGVGAPEA